MQEPPLYELSARLLGTEDAEWVARFAAGEEWWSQEVTAFLRDDAIEHAQAGFNTTILFSFPDLKEIVGFVTAASSSLELKDVQPALTIASAPAQRIPAAIIPFMGVARTYRQLGFGEEIHVQLLEAITGQWAGTRLMYCECWEENEAGLRFWKKRGYVEFGRFKAPRPDGAGRASLIRLVFDRFALPAPAA